MLISLELQMSDLPSLKIYAPATIANLGSGYDIFSIALNEPGDIIEFIPRSDNEIHIVNEAASFPNMPLDIEMNATTVPMMQLMNDHGIKAGFDIVFKQKIRPGSGLGSSAASSCAGVFYLKKAFGLTEITNQELVNYAREGERIACGSPIADNVASCINGGFNLVRSLDPFDLIELDFPRNIWLAVVHPEIEILTSESRAVLPSQIKLETAVKQWAQTAALVAGMSKGDFDLIAKATDDFVVEPKRKELINGFDQIKSEALENGALNCSISGAGPSLFSFCRSKELAELIALKMKAAFAIQNIKSDVYTSTINADGIKVI